LRLYLFLLTFIATLLWGILCPAAASSSRSAPASSYIWRLLAEAGGAKDQGARKKAEAELRSLARRFSGLIQEEFLKLQASENLLAEILRREAGVQCSELFFARKFRQAQEAFREGRYEFAERLCEALLVLGVRGSTELKVRRLARLARDRAFAGGVLFVDLKAEKEVLQDRDPLKLTLSLSNRTDQPVKVKVSASGLFGQLHFGVTTMGYRGEFFGRERSEDLRIPGGEIRIAAGEKWKHSLLVRRSPDEGPFLVERLSVKGYLVPSTIESGGRVFSRRLRVPRVEVIRVPGGRSKVAADPVAGLREAIKAGRIEEIYLAAALCGWEGKFEESVEILLKGTKKSALRVADACYNLLRLLTGRNFGKDRRKWIVYYLSHERLPIAGPFSEW